MSACDRARLTWRCRRGMLELDAWLSGFLTRHGPLTDADCTVMLQLLEAEDDVLYDWLLARAEPPAELIGLVRRIRHTRYMAGPP